MGQYAINHCGQRDEIQGAGLDKVDLQEAVIACVGAIISARLHGQTRKPHKLEGVELLAQVIAAEVMKAGAEKLCADFEIELQPMIDHASSSHISYC